jgi:hypothetical protein
MCSPAPRGGSYWRASAASDVHTGETIDGGRRIQKFKPQGKMQKDDFGEPFMAHPHYDPLPN